MAQQIKRHNLTPSERLIVAADFKPNLVQFQGRKWVRDQVLELSKSLKRTGVTIKLNSALRACGCDLTGEIQGMGLRVMADLKLNDIPETLATDGALLAEVAPELLTVMANSGPAAVEALKKELPSTEVLGVTVLTSFDEELCKEVYGGRSIQGAVRFLTNLVEAHLDGLVASARHAELLRISMGLKGHELTINTPAIRPSWSMVKGDDQNPAQVKTPAEAIAAGVDRIIVGRPITRASSPYDAAMKTLEEIAEVMAQQSAEAV